MRILIILSFLVFIGSCKNEFEYREDRLLGSWEFSDATEEEVGAFSTRFSIFGDYKNDQIEFKEDGTLIYQEAAGGGSILSGIWSITSINVVSDNLSNTEYILTMSMQDAAGQLKQYTWEISTLTFDKLECKTTTQNYIYCYELIKL